MEIAVKKTPILERLADALVREQTQPQGQEVMICMPSLEQEFRDCLAQMHRNQERFDWEIEPELIEELIYEYQALQCRYRYLQRKARNQQLRAIL